MRHFGAVPAVALWMLGWAYTASAAESSAADFAGKWEVTAQFAGGSTAALLTLTPSGGKIKGSSGGLDARQRRAADQSRYAGNFGMDLKSSGSCSMTTRA